MPPGSSSSARLPVGEGAGEISSSCLDLAATRDQRRVVRGESEAGLDRSACLLELTSDQRRTCKQAILADVAGHGGAPLPVPREQVVRIAQGCLRRDQLVVEAATCPTSGSGARAPARPFACQVRGRPRSRSGGGDERGS